MHVHPFPTAQIAREFILAGNATITLTSLRTGAHFTYRIRQAHDDKNQPVRRWFVSLLSGPNNETDYTYLGLLDQRNGDIEFRLTAKSRASQDALSVRGFLYMWNRLYADNIPADLTIRHEGHCGRCGRTLTVPESLDRGIGPECWQKMAA